ncbi:MAG: hypothetical protein KIT54_07525 [Phycisphaeraceae bacterium]|nr:hypothetical protein [Phycisphaeraceae bacterium]
MRQFSWRRAVPAFLVAGVCVAQALGSPLPARDAGQAWQVRDARQAGGHAVASLERAPGSDAALAGRAERLEGFPLPDGAAVSLVLEPMRVLAHGARIVVVDDAGEREAGFDPASIAFWRGTVEGYHGSHVFLSVAEGSTIGRIELGAGRPTYGISSSGGEPSRGGVALRPGEVAVFRSTATAPPLAAPVACGGALHGAKISPAGPMPMAPIGLPDAPGDEPTVGPARYPPIANLRMAPLAVDSDYAFFELFNDERAALTYLLQCYAMVSDICIRDVGVRLDMIFLRVFTTRDADPYARGGAGMPFAIPRDLPARLRQLMSGRKDATAGGAAWVCRPDSWVAYALGRFPDPATGFALGQDVRIAAHEIGHNFGAFHTHDRGIDQCDRADSRPRRGTLLSYCAQTFSGGTRLTDAHFHRIMRQDMVTCVDQSFLRDCNQNGIDDALDIASGRSQDADGDGVPDECQDCNGNGILDSIDIATGTSLDLNMNGIPDECEPDCNGNGIPDDLDIASGFSLDRNGDGIPDECQADLDGNGIFDWVDIFEDMSLDIDRDGVLDAYQDCNGDGMPDIIALNKAHNLWAVSSGDERIKEYHFTSGVLRDQSDLGLLLEPTDVLVTANRRVLVASAGDARIAEFDADGRFVADLVPSALGGLLYPSALAISADGWLLVADRDAHAVRRYDIDTGASLGDLVEPMSGGLQEPTGLTVGPNGNLFVNTEHAGVIEYDGVTGAHVRQFIEHGAGGLHHGRGLLFIPTRDHSAWRFLTTNGQGHNVLEFDAGTGAYVGVFNEGDFRGKLRDPWGLRLGPDGHVYVSSARRHMIHDPTPPATALVRDRLGLHLTFPHVFKYDGHSGKLIGAYVQGIDSQLSHPKGIAFMPDMGLDRNANGVPDACERSCAADCDGSGTVDLIDFLCFQNRFASGDMRADCNGDGVLDLFDFLCFLEAFGLGCE